MMGLIRGTIQKAFLPMCEYPELWDEALGAWFDMLYPTTGVGSVWVGGPKRGIRTNKGTGSLEKRHVCSIIVEVKKQESK